MPRESIPVHDEGHSWSRIRVIRTPWILHCLGRRDAPHADTRICLEASLKRERSERGL